MIDREGASSYRVHCFFFILMQTDENPGDLHGTVLHLRTKVTELKVCSECKSAWGKMEMAIQNSCISDFLFKTVWFYKYLHIGNLKNKYLCTEDQVLEILSYRRKVKTMKEPSIFIFPCEKRKVQ